MAILPKFIIIAVFTTIFLPGCRILSPSDQPYLAGEPLQQVEIAETAATTEIAPPATATPGITAAEKTEQKSITQSVERSVKLRLNYTVSEGELLWSIAKRPDVYGDPLLWPLLYQANRDQIKDPRKIYAGQTLTIPRTISEEEREKARNLAKKTDIFSPE